MATVVSRRPISVARATVRTTAKNFPVKSLAGGPRFGTHLTLDGYGADARKLNDMRRIYDSLEEIVSLLNMKKLVTPYVVHYAGNGQKDLGGYSGMVLIAQSHISIHTFPSEGFVTIDVYTCQGDLDIKTATAYFQQKFGVSEWEQHVIKRGTKYTRA